MNIFKNLRQKSNVKNPTGVLPPELAGCVWNEIGGSSSASLLPDLRNSPDSQDIVPPNRATRMSPKPADKNACATFVRRHRAFTLFEILVAVALLGALLAVLATLAFQIMGYWSRQTEDPLFDRHVDGLRRALEECVAETTESENAGGKARTPANIFRESPGGTTLPYLRITGAPEFLLSDVRPLGNIDAWAEFREGVGLILHWRTDAEKRDSPSGDHEFLLSPWVTGMTFSSYDTTNNAWTEIGATPAAGDVTANSSVFMKLTLNHRGQIREISLTLADAAPHNLNY